MFSQMGGGRILCLVRWDGVTARVWCRGRIDRKRNSTINLTTDSGACY